jgi:8-oxo-dGTP diphosphatase
MIKFITNCNIYNKVVEKKCNFVVNVTSMNASARAFRPRIQQEDIYSIPIDDFFKSAFSVDCVIFGYHEKQLKVLLIERGTEPFGGFWALPGDLVYPYEDLDAAASRVLKDLTSLSDIAIKQVHTFGKVDRHPLGRVITVAYMAIVEMQDIRPQASSWASDTKWHSIKRLPKLAFDHKEIIMSAYHELQDLVRRQPLWNRVLPEKFTLTQLQEFYETILSKTYDKGNFRKKTQSMFFIQALNESQQNVRHRPSTLYKFDEKKYREYKENDLQIEL